MATMAKSITFHILPKMMLLAALLSPTDFSFPKEKETIYLRANQIGYLPEEEKITIAFSHQPAEKRRFEIIDAASGKAVWGPVKFGHNAGAWGKFAYHYRLDFSPFNLLGRFKLRIVETTLDSLPVNIGVNAYGAYHELLLA